MTAVATIPANTLAAQPLNWDGELRGAAALMKSGLVPADIKTPEAALFIILTGRDLGMSPVQSLRSIRVIKGKVEVAADAQLGKFHSAGGKSRFIELTDTVAKLELHAAWLKAPHVESFSITDANHAGLTGDNWKKYPKAMLRSRAITAGLKSIGFDACAGIYGHGEISGEEIVITETGEVSATERPANVTTDGEIVEDGVRVLTMPGKPEKWSGNGGKPLADTPSPALASFVKWARADEERSAKFDVELQEAQRVLAEREGASQDELIEAGAS